MKYISTISLFILLLATGCGDAGKGQVNAGEKRPELAGPIAEEDAFTELHLDSVLLETFIKEAQIGESRAEALREFYQSRDFQFAWFTSEGLAQHTLAFWNLHNNFLNYSQDSSLFNKGLHKQMERLMTEEELPPGNAPLSTLELQLTVHFFDYAGDAFTGKIDAKELKWHIPRKKVNPVALLDSLIASNGEKIEDWEPLNQQYKLIRQELYRLYKIEKGGGWPPVTLEAKGSLRRGDSSAVITDLKNRLRISGDYPDGDHSALFTAPLEAAVKRFQKRMGLESDGAVGPATLGALNVSATDRIKQVLVNMERMRWMPPHGSGKRLVANIPEFKLHVFEGDNHVFEMKIVVGKEANRTVIFNDQLKHVVFSPYWNVPRSIVRAEILPAMNRNPNYLSANNMEQRGTSGGLPVIRQKPGPKNALGKVKFIFPNSYNIYFHDTPAKSLFSRSQRAFSHGCIRLEEPKKLAQYLLQDVRGWTEEKITAAMNAGKEQWVQCPPVAVVISYFTAWVDNEGLLNFRDDIYGHDKELAQRLFEN